jgi:cell volume regulation protein A
MAAATWFWGRGTVNAGLQLLALLASFVLLGLLLSRLASLIRIPDVVVFLVAGLALGAVGLRPFAIADAPGQAFTAFAAAYILFQGGEAVQLAVLRRIWLSVFPLSTLGVLISMFVVGVIALPLLSVSLPVGLLICAVVAATDPAVLIPIYRGLSVPGRVAQLIISESALNHATAAMGALVMAHLVVMQSLAPWYPRYCLLGTLALSSFDR